VLLPLTSVRAESVTGAGMIGLCVARVLKAMRVSRIIINGRRSKRLELARESGAGVVVDAATEDIAPVVKEVTSDVGPVLVFPDAPPVPDCIHQFHLYTPFTIP